MDQVEANRAAGVYMEELYDALFDTLDTWRTQVGERDDMPCVVLDAAIVSALMRVLESPVAAMLAYKHDEDVDDHAESAQDFCVRLFSMTQDHIKQSKPAS